MDGKSFSSPVCSICFRRTPLYTYVVFNCLISWILCLIIYSHKIYCEFFKMWQNVFCHNENTWFFIYVSYEFSLITVESVDVIFNVEWVKNSLKEIWYENDLGFFKIRLSSYQIFWNTRNPICFVRRRRKVSNKSKLIGDFTIAKYVYMVKITRGEQISVNTSYICCRDLRNISLRRSHMRIRSLDYVLLFSTLINWRFHNRMKSNKINFIVSSFSVRTK